MSSMRFGQVTKSSGRTEILIEVCLEYQRAPLNQECSFNIRCYCDIVLLAILCNNL